MSRIISFNLLSSRKEINYNFCHSSTRTTVERSIGIVKRRWHCLKGLRVNPNKACIIITVCMMLNNRARLLNLPDPDSDEEDEGDDAGDDSDGNDDAVIQPATERARVHTGNAARNRIINDFF